MYYKRLSTSARFPEYLNLAHSIVEIEVCSSLQKITFVNLFKDEMVLCCICHCIQACLYVSALYQARGLEADGGGFQVHLPIQQTFQPSGANQRSHCHSAPV